MANSHIRGDVVQARDVSGGIHFYAGPDGRQAVTVIPRQLPAEVRAFVDRRPELRSLNRLVAAGQPQWSIIAIDPYATVSLKTRLINPHLLSLELYYRAPTPVKKPQYANLIMEAIPSIIPVNRVPFWWRKSRIGRLGLVLQNSRITFRRASQRGLDKIRQHSSHKLPYVLTSYPVRKWYAFKLRKNRTRVDSLVHPMNRYSY